MAVSIDRNFWDPPTRPGDIDDVKRARVVELFIYRFDKSSRDEPDIIKDVTGASQFWCKANINIQAAFVDTLPSTLPSEPVNMNANDVAALVTCADHREAFFALPRAENPDLIPSPNEDDSSQFQSTGDVIQHGKRGGLLCRHRWRSDLITMPLA